MEGRIENVVREGYTERASRRPPGYDVEKSEDLAAFGPGSFHDGLAHSITNSSSSIHSTPHLEPALSRAKSTVSAVITRVTSRVDPPITTIPGPPPDGGLHAWSQCFCAWLVIMNTWGFSNSFGAFQTYYESILPQNPSAISWIGSIQAWLLFFLGAFSGRALDAGLFRSTVIIGAILLLLGLFMMSLSTKYWQLFLTQGVLAGIGGGIIFCPVMGLLSTYFAKKRGLAVGIATSGNALGGIVYPLIVRQLLPRIGFAWTARVLGFVNVLCLSLAVVVMKPRLPPRKTGPIIEWTAIKDIPYVLFVIGVCFLMAPVFFVFYYIGSFARNIIGLGYQESVNLIMIVNGVGVPTRVIPGFLADRYFGVLNTFATCVLINMVLLWGWMGVKDMKGLYVFTAIFGLPSAAFQSLLPTSVVSLGDDISKNGTRLGMAFTTISFAALLGGPIGGALLQIDGGNYLPSQVWVGMSTVIGLCLVVSARVTKHGWSWKVKC